MTGTPIKEGGKESTQNYHEMSIKNWLKISVALNILIVLFIAGKRIYYSRGGSPVNVRQQAADHYDTLFRKIYDPLPIDSTDIVFIGTSITQNFPIGEMLGPEFKNRGITNNTTRHILGRLEGIKKAKLVFIEAGVNDFIVDNRSVAETFENYKRILSALPGRCVVQSIFPVSGDYSIYTDSVSSLNKLLKDYCTGKGIPFLDIGITGMGHEYSIDGIHPNGRVYNMWAEAVREWLRVKDR